jgi:hypothetical protein
LQKTARQYPWLAYNKNVDQRNKDCEESPNEILDGIGWMNVSGICLV